MPAMMPDPQMTVKRKTVERRYATHRILWIDRHEKNGKRNPGWEAVSAIFGFDYGVPKPLEFAV
jgi:hypothetical protein